MQEAMSFALNWKNLVLSQKKKAVDVNIGTRDNLKSYAAEKQSGTASNV